MNLAIAFLRSTGTLINIEMKKKYELVEYISSIKDAHLR
jgi:hypothetical protein